MAQNAVLRHGHGVITGKEGIHTAAGYRLGSAWSMGRCDNGSERVGRKLHPTLKVEELDGWESELRGRGVLVGVGNGGVVVDAVAADGVAEKGREEDGRFSLGAEEVVRDAEGELERDVIEETRR